MDTSDDLSSFQSFYEELNLNSPLKKNTQTQPINRFV